jgi:hypothetical protein
MVAGGTIVDLFAEASQIALCRRNFQEINA